MLEPEIPLSSPLPLTPPALESCELSVAGIDPPVSEPLLPQAASSSAAHKASAIWAGIILIIVESP